MYDVGRKLKLIRQQRCMTQKELATRINKSVSAISSYESNAQLPPLDVLESISSALNVSLDFIVGNEDNVYFSTQSLTPDQAELIELLFREFSLPHPESDVLDVLTRDQIFIIQKLLHLFTYRKESPNAKKEPEEP